MQQFSLCISASALLLTSNQKGNEKFETRFIETKAAYKFHESAAFLGKSHLRSYFSHRDDWVNSVCGQTFDPCNDPFEGRFPSYFVILFRCIAIKTHPQIKRVRSTEKALAEPCSHLVIDEYTIGQDSERSLC